MIEQKLIDGLMTFVKLVHEREHEMGTKFNVSFRIGMVDIKIDLTADNLMFRMNMETAHWEDGNRALFTSKRSFRCRAVNSDMMGPPNDGNKDPMLELDAFFLVVNTINIRLKNANENKNARE